MVILHGQRDFADTIKITDQLTLEQRGQPGFSRWAQCKISRALKGREKKHKRKQREVAEVGAQKHSMCCCWTADEGGRGHVQSKRGPQPYSCKEPNSANNSEAGSSPEPLDESSDQPTLISACEPRAEDPAGPCCAWTSDTHNCEIINRWCYRPLHLW